MDVEALELFGKNTLKLLQKRRDEGGTEIHEFLKSDAAIYSEFAFFKENLEGLFELLEEMKKVKQVLDPENILGRGTILM